MRTFHCLFKANGLIPIHFDTFHLPYRKSPLIDGIINIGKQIFCKFLLNHFYNRNYEAESFFETFKVANEISRGKINSSRRFKIIKYLSNYIDDENIFFVRKASPTKH